MKKITPDYFKKFICIASDCKDNCCYGGWQIDIDDDTLAYYGTVGGEFGERLKAAIDTENQCFALKDGVCPFLDDKNLCEIYGTLGPEHMGVVCTQFPRFSEYYGHTKETGIGLACEEAARIILSEGKSFCLEVTDLDEEEYEDSEFDRELYETLFEVRNKFFELNDSRRLSIKQTLAKILEVCDGLQQLINDNDYAGMKKYAAKFEPYETCDTCRVSEEKYLDTMNAVWSAFGELECLKDEWEDVVDNAFTQLEADDYLKRVADFEKNTAAYENDYRSLLDYYIFRYFLKASYDHDVLSKAQFFAACYFAQRDMDLMDSDRMKNIHIFSREVEYDTDNLEILTEEFMFGDEMSADNLIKILASSDF